mmetsp:Transcript_38419/g.64429  ORF Transcript_38419/g.64429 Transcript_38419/m.64429 type:complete len:728 (+) Transcript_38419:211-2394(+)
MHRFTGISILLAFMIIMGESSSKNQDDEAALTLLEHASQSFELPTDSDEEHQRQVLRQQQRARGYVDYLERGSNRSITIGPAGFEALINVNDLLVHEDYGFCRYSALFESSIRLQFKDGCKFVDWRDRHLLTKYHAHGSRIVGRKNKNATTQQEQQQPELSALCEHRSWVRRKNRVKAYTAGLAEKLAGLYVQRQTIFRKPCSAHDPPDYEAFERSFPHSPTSDQIRCFQEVRYDMTRKCCPMDRLLCGDVGSGKTEVALRAVFRAVLNKRQVALLAPTTILAAQHVQTMRSRFPSWINVSLLLGGSHQKASYRQRVYRSLADGSCQVVVGTQSLLRGTALSRYNNATSCSLSHSSKRVRSNEDNRIKRNQSMPLQFRNLGLIVIDEEQRFGVVQKEHLKRMVAPGVDVLSLSATPIPRTLQMAQLGIRGLSRLLNPPPGRKIPKTLVEPYSKTLFCHALIREAKRKGQILYVVARRKQVPERARRLRRILQMINNLNTIGALQEEQAWNDLLDDVDIEQRCCDDGISSSVDEEGEDEQEEEEEEGNVEKQQQQQEQHQLWRNGNGRVICAVGGEADLEKKVLAFSKGKAEILVATTVLENGLDLPNANTLIVENSHMYGLAQLHQLRGRVGRRSQQGHALFLIPKRNYHFNEQQRQRLESIKSSLTGDDIASNDLKIRGAGSLLGEQQSGHVEDIGYDLYQELLRREIANKSKPGEQWEVDKKRPF